MGVPANSSVSGEPPSGDQANTVLSGALIGLGVTPFFVLYGAFNLFLWGSVTTNLTTTSGSAAASVASGTGIAAGQYVNSPNVPPGTTWGTFSGTSGTLLFAPGQVSTSIISGTAPATFGTVAVSATVQLERSFDGGHTWLICGVGGGGQQAVYINPGCISVVASEVERGMLYRLNCVAYTSGTLNYRISTTGLMATSAGVPPG